MIVTPRGREKAQNRRDITTLSSCDSGAVRPASARRCTMRAIPARAAAANRGAAHAPTTDQVVPSTAITAATSARRQIGMNRFCTTV